MAPYQATHRPVGGHVMLTIRARDRSSMGEVTDVMPIADVGGSARAWHADAVLRRKGVLGPARPL